MGEIAEPRLLDHIVPGYVQKKTRIMKFFSKFFKGSNHKISEGQYPGNCGDEYGNWDTGSSGLEGHGHSDTEELDHAIALSLSEEELKKANEIGGTFQVDDDEELARALQASLDVGSPPRADPTPRVDPTPRADPTPYYPPPYGYHPSGYKICAGCNREIGYGRFLSCMGAYWHPHCFQCHSCGEAISEHEFSMSGNDPYHKKCYKELYHPKCDVCKHFIPTNRAGLIEYRAHPFWGQRYCPSHEQDSTPRCCSCERMEPRNEQYISLDDGRKLCLECLDSSIMDTNECQPLYLDIRDFYEGLNMKITQQIPMLLVERQALNEAIQGEKEGSHHMPETRGLCLSEEQTVSSIFRRPKIGGNRILDMFTESQKLTRRCEVTAILILYGLPRLLTGSILAHELMHAWLRLNGYRTLRPDVEEGICQVLSHMWLETEIMAGTGSSSHEPSSSSRPQPSSKAKKGVGSKFEKELGKFFMHQIAMDTSPAYGDGFRAGQAAVLQFGLRRTLAHIRMTGTFP